MSLLELVMIDDTGKVRCQIHTEYFQMNQMRHPRKSCHLFTEYQFPGPFRDQPIDCLVEQSTHSKRKACNRDAHTHTQ